MYTSLNEYSVLFEPASIFISVLFFLNILKEFIRLWHNNRVPYFTYLILFSLFSVKMNTCSAAVVGLAMLLLACRIGKANVNIKY